MASVDAAISAAYYEGLRDGVRRYAWWKDGTQYVGGGVYTLADAIAGIDRAERAGEPVPGMTPEHAVDQGPTGTVTRLADVFERADIDADMAGDCGERTWALAASTVRLDQAPDTATRYAVVAELRRRAGGHLRVVTP